MPHRAYAACRVGCTANLDPAGCGTDMYTRNLAHMPILFVHMFARMPLHDITSLVWVQTDARAATATRTTCNQLCEPTGGGCARTRESGPTSASAARATPDRSAHRQFILRAGKERGGQPRSPFAVTASNSVLLLLQILKKKCKSGWHACNQCPLV